MKGCGAKIIWGDLKRLPDIDDILMNFYQVKTIDEVL